MQKGQVSKALSIKCSISCGLRPISEYCIPWSTLSMQMASLYDAVGSTLQYAHCLDVLVNKMGCTAVRG